MSKTVLGLHVKRRAGKKEQIRLTTLKLTASNKLWSWRHNMAPPALYAGRCGPAAAHPLRLRRPCSAPCFQFQ